MNDPLAADCLKEGSVELFQGADLIHLSAPCLTQTSLLKQGGLCGSLLSKSASALSCAIIQTGVFREGILWKSFWAACP